MTPDAASPAVCVDSSLVIAMLLPEALTAPAEALWTRWLSEERLPMVAPHFHAEVVSGIRRAATRGRISAAAEAKAMETFVNNTLPNTEVAFCTGPTWQRAWQWAQQLKRANVYDTIYLAVAEAAGAEFWTADENLYRALEAAGRPAPEWVHLVTP